MNRRRLSCILTETYATLPSRGGACNHRATRTLDGHVNVLTVSVLLPKQVWRMASTRRRRGNSLPPAVAHFTNPRGADLLRRESNFAVHFEYGSHVPDIRAILGSVS
jgi:hypothetical protein